MPKRRNALLLLAIMALTVLLAGCAASVSLPEETPQISVETPEPSPTLVPTPAPTPTPSPAPTPEPTPEEKPAYEAEAVPVTLHVDVDGRKDVHLLTDADYNTRLRLPENTEIFVQTEMAVKALYIIWETVPDACSVSAGSYTLECGENGFLHEYVELPEEVTDFKIDLPQGGLLCDIYAYTDGRLPEYVQIWEPSVDRADILLFPTHGDDELLFFGSILPYYAGELGLSVQVVYLIDHAPERPRQHEQLDGLWTVGVTAYPVFGKFADTYVRSINKALQFYNYYTVIEYQVEMIRRFRPQVIVDHDVRGEYGQGAHALNTACMKEAVELAADETYDRGDSLEKYGVWDTPKFYIHLLQENNISLDYDQPLERFGGRTAYEMAVEGYDRHQSQQQWSFYVYTKDAAYDCSSFGLYRSTVGEDVAKNDLMENLTPYGEQ